MCSRFIRKPYRAIYTTLHPLICIVYTSDIIFGKLAWMYKSYCVFRYTAWISSLNGSTSVSDNLCQEMITGWAFDGINLLSGCGSANRLNAQPAMWISRRVRDQIIFKIPWYKEWLIFVNSYKKIYLLLNAAMDQKLQWISEKFFQYPRIKQRNWSYAAVYDSHESSGRICFNVCWISLVQFYALGDNKIV